MGGSYPSSYGNIDTCLQIGGSLELRDEGSRDSWPETGPVYVYEAPPVSTIAGGVLQVHVKTPHGEAYIATPENNLEVSNELFKCTTQCASGEEKTIAITHVGGWELFAGALCIPPAEESACAAGLDAELDISSAKIVLRNESTPTANGFAGSLLNDPASGKASLTFNAKDKEGPGVYRVSAQVDGQVVSSATPNVNEGKCVAYGTYYGALNFHYRQPCPQETAVSIEIPTSGITDGEHQLKVEVEDAAGNTATVYSGAITIANDPISLVPEVPTTPTTITPTVSSAAPPARGPANGSPASEDATIAAHWQGASGVALASSYGHSRQIEGRLTDSAGAPIAGAVIEVSQRASSLGAIASSMTAAHTSPEGTFTLRVPASDSSANIEIVYRSHLGDAQPAATDTLTLRVPAHLHLTISKHVTSVGHTVVLHGTLAGPLPSSGKQVIFEARAVGSRQWIEFHNVTVTGSGAFKTGHRFVLPGPERYQFRVVCEPEPAFGRGVSNVVVVRER